MDNIRYKPPLTMHTSESQTAAAGRGISYALVTPAHNEESYIEKTILSVISQTCRPAHWVIVSDGSVDRTNEIVEHYQQQNAWIELVRLPVRHGHHFAAKVNAFNAGYKRLEGREFDLIGNVDADISFDPLFFESLLARFLEDSRLGVAGAPFVESKGKRWSYDYRYTSVEHVSGACQLFRRECFEEIGGYFPVRIGGIDWIAVTTARMKGWKTRTFVELSYQHHRSIGTGGGGRLASWFRQGRKDYCLGGHPLWQIFRSVYQMGRRPWIVGGLLLFSGFVSGYVSTMERPISRDLIRFHQTEQMCRLRRMFLTAFRKAFGSPA